MCEERDLLANKDDAIDADRLSEQLRVAALKPVFHGVPEILTLKELVRNYNNLVEDSTRVMLRIKAIFRARAIPTPGVSYRATRRKDWLAKLDGGARVRAESLLTQLDALLELRPKAKAAMIAAARRLPGWMRTERHAARRMCARRACERRDAVTLGNSRGASAPGS